MDIYAFQISPNKMVAMFLDITEMKISDEELENYRKHLEELVIERTSELTKSNELLQLEVLERKWAEEELRKLSLAVEQSPNSIIITDLNGNIEYINPTFAEFTGFTSQEIIGKNIQSIKFVTEEIKTLVSDDISNSGFWQGEFSQIKEDGNTYWASVSISAIRNDVGAITHFLGIGKDITNLKKSELEVIETNEFVNNIIESMIDMLIVLNPDRTIRKVNKSVLNLLKYPESELIGKQINQILKTK